MATKHFARQRGITLYFDLKEDKRFFSYFDKETDTIQSQADKR